MLMKSVRSVLAAFVVALTAIAATPANAAPILLQYDFTAQNFFSFGGPPPNDPVSGSFTIASFTYDATNTAFNAAPNGNGLNIAFGRSSPGADNFMLQFLLEDDGAPIFGPDAFSYTTSLTGFAMFQTINVLVTTAQFSLEVFPNPIPAALPLMISALAGLGVMGWRRRRVTLRS
jgi:hypothetical protein